ASGPSSDLDLGAVPGKIFIQAEGGFGGPGNDGNGGTANLSAGRDIRVNLSEFNVSVMFFFPGIDAAPAGDNGYGANYNFTAGRDISVANASINASAVGNGAGGIVSLQAGGRLVVDSSIFANGSGTGGNGGTITLLTNGPAELVIGSNDGTSFVNGSLNAAAGTDGTGGAISATSNGTGGMEVEGLGSLNVSTP